MPSDRLRSIVPMFGGGIRYVEILYEILARVESHHPTTDELVGWQIATLLRIMCNRNVGLRSLLYDLSADPMTIDEITPVG